MDRRRAHGPCRRPPSRPRLRPLVPSAPPTNAPGYDAPPLLLAALASRLPGIGRAMVHGPVAGGSVEEPGVAVVIGVDAHLAPDHCVADHLELDAQLV